MLYPEMLMTHQWYSGLVDGRVAVGDDEQHVRHVRAVPVLRQPREHLRGMGTRDVSDVQGDISDVGQGDKASRTHSQWDKLLSAMSSKSSLYTRTLRH